MSLTRGARQIVKQDVSGRQQVLFISYAFPPVGGAGVQRAVKFVKYLPDCGWQPTVLTVANPSVPVQDSDLGGEVASSVEVVRARTWEPSYRHKQPLIDNVSGRPSRVKQLLRKLALKALQPDPQVLWNPAAYRIACRLLQRRSFEALVVSGPPFSSMILGRNLKRRFGIPLVLDFRDEWTLSSRYLENRVSGESARRGEVRQIESTLRAADGVIATTQASAAELSASCRAAGNPLSARCIYNGFDPDDFKNLPSAKPNPDRFRLVYTGTLWNLTDVGPLVSAVESLAEQRPDLAQRLSLVFVGRRTPAQEALLARIRGLPVQLELSEYMPHLQALQVAAESDALCVLLADKPGAERVVPGKLFEYLALGRPILAITPQGEAAQLLSRSSQATVFGTRQIDPIARWLMSRIEDKLDPLAGVEARVPTHFAAEPSAGATELSWCSRPELTRQLAELLGGLTRFSSRSA